MKLKFKQQAFQRDATMAVVNCFDGQNKGIRKEIVGRTGFMIDEIFSNNKLGITEKTLFKNIQEIQKEQGLKTTPKIAGLHGKPHLNLTWKKRD